MSFWEDLIALLPDLQAYARSVARNSDDAADLVNDAIERAAKSDCKPTDPKALKPWLFRVLRNLYVDEVRKKRTRLEYSTAVARLSIGQEQQRPKVDDAIAVSIAYDKLRARDKEIIFLIDVSGFSYKEVSAVLNVPRGTVMSRISRARRALLDEVEGENESRTATLLAFRKRK